jgi:adenylylsulfate kinase
MPWVLWITGLPGSGKSTIALAVREKTPDSVILRIDEIRKVITPEPTYSDTEREYVYRALVFTAKTLYEQGHKVIIDATGHRKSWRVLAKRSIPDFIEVYLNCPVETCMKREKTRVAAHSAPEKIYDKGAKGWPVPGVNVAYEKTESPDIIIDTEHESIDSSVKKILMLLRKPADDR